VSVFGVLHPFFVHFPVGLVITAAILECLAMRQDRSAPSPHTLPLLIVSSLTAVAAAFTGWISADRPLSTSLLEQVDLHRWLSVITTVSLLITTLYWRKISSPRLKVGRIFLLISVLLVASTGHLGSEITHGKDVYRNALRTLLGSSQIEEQQIRQQVSWAEAELDRWSLKEDQPVDYVEHIQPILVGRCLECHGPSVKRGGLRLDSLRQVLLEGDLGPAIVPGNREISGIWVRCATESEDRPQMPKGESPLPAEWIEAIGRWVDEGANWPHPEPTPWLEKEN